MSKSKMNFIDRAIGFLSPQAALSRVVAREKLFRKYEGATTTRRTAGWSTTSTSSQKETFQSLPKLRERSRDLIQNNAYAKRGFESVVSNVVGKGILAQITDTSSLARERRINEIWKNWTESTECDYEGSKNFYGIQRLLQRSIFENGEALVVRRQLKSNEFKHAPLSLQMFEPDHLDSQGYYSKPALGNKILQGVEFDQKGKRVAYHIFKEHPGGFGTSKDTIRVLSEDVLHVYDELRIGQIRGIPHLSPAIIKIKDFDEYEDAQLIRQKMAACFAAFIGDMDMPEDGEYDDEEQSILEKLEPGTIDILPRGKKIEFATPPTVDGYAEYSKSNIRGIACALGISYEALSMDYSNVNFSSGRMGWIEMQRTVEDIRHHVLIPKFLNPVIGWWYESITLMGYNTENLKTTWTPPRREMIDPTSEIEAMIEGIQSGLMTYSETLQHLGKDPDDHIERIKKDFQKLDLAGIKLTSDPRVATLSQTAGPEKKSTKE